MLLPALLASMAPGRTLHAQNVDREQSACLGVTFGPWTPPLDWRAAGHGSPPDTGKLVHAPDGRDWASSAVAGEPDSLLILFPAWWPAGVAVELPTRTLAAGDTVIGRAHAFIAYGNRPVPTSRVRAWRVPCTHRR